MHMKEDMEKRRAEWEKIILNALTRKRIGDALVSFTSEEATVDYIYVEKEAVEENVPQFGHVLVIPPPSCGFACFFSS